jgi:hypothetical protein
MERGARGVNFNILSDFKKNLETFSLPIRPRNSLEKNPHPQKSKKKIKQLTKKTQLSHQQLRKDLILLEIDPLKDSQCDELHKQY